MPFTLWVTAQQPSRTSIPYRLSWCGAGQSIILSCLCGLVASMETKWIEQQSLEGFFFSLLSAKAFPIQCLFWLVIVFVDSETIQFVGCVLVVTGCSLFSDLFPLFMFIENGAEYWINHYLSSPSELFFSLFLSPPLPTRHSANEFGVIVKANLFFFFSFFYFFPLASSKWRYRSITWHNRHLISSAAQNELLLAAWLSHSHHSVSVEGFMLSVSLVIRLSCWYCLRIL